jgi:hypothetical protein
VVTRTALVVSDPAQREKCADEKMSSSCCHVADLYAGQQANVRL